MRMHQETGTGPDLEEAVRSLGARLGCAIEAVVEGVDGVSLGPQRFSESLGVDKVLVSRILKALRCEAVIDRLHHMPGPVPLRRFLRAARRRLDVPVELHREAMEAVDDFEALLADRIGDRSALTSLLTAWSKEVRAEFELRRKQAAWRAMSELLGSVVELTVSTAVLGPATEPGRVDLTWVMGQFGLRRLRPGVVVTASTRRMGLPDGDREPEGLDGRPLRDLVGERLEQFCDRPMGQMSLERHGDLHQYTLSGDDYGPNSAIDLLVAEVNPAELPTRAPHGSGRRAWLSKHAITPAKEFVFDVLVHRDIFPDGAPELIILGPGCGHDNNPNEPSHRQHRLDLLEEVVEIAPTSDGLELAAFRRYPEVIGHVLRQLDCNAPDFRAYRVKINYPPTGIHVVLAFPTPEEK